jgi:hypothetical protein
LQTLPPPPSQTRSRCRHLLHVLLHPKPRQTQAVQHQKPHLIGVEKIRLACFCFAKFDLQCITPGTLPNKTYTGYLYYLHPFDSCHYRSKPSSDMPANTLPMHIRCLFCGASAHSNRGRSQVLNGRGARRVQLNGCDHVIKC